MERGKHIRGMRINPNRKDKISSAINLIQLGIVWLSTMESTFRFSWLVCFISKCLPLRSTFIFPQFSILDAIYFSFFILLFFFLFIYFFVFCFSVCLSLSLSLYIRLFLSITHKLTLFFNYLFYSFFFLFSFAILSSRPNHLLTIHHLTQRYSKWCYVYWW